MLTTPDGQELRSSNGNDDKKLRGGRLEQIRKDLKNEELSDREKMLKYSSHLEWFLSKVNTLFLAQEAMMHPGKWDRSLMALGFTNGLIMAMAIFGEEQGEPPYCKVPEKLDKDTNRLISEEAKGYMITLARQLEAAICIDEQQRPKGYTEHNPEYAWMNWLNDTVEHLKRCPFDFPEISAMAERIQKFNPDTNDQEDGSEQ